MKYNGNDVKILNKFFKFLLAGGMEDKLTEEYYSSSEEIFSDILSAFEDYEYRIKNLEREISNLKDDLNYGVYSSRMA